MGAIDDASIWLLLIAKKFNRASRMAQTLFSTAIDHEGVASPFPFQG